MYNSPRVSSRAISEAEPPMATTDPKTGVVACSAGGRTEASMRNKSPWRHFDCISPIRRTVGIFINDPNGYQTKKLTSVGLPLVNSELLPKGHWLSHQV